MDHVSSRCLFSYRYYTWEISPIAPFPELNMTRVTVFPSYYALSHDNDHIRQFKERDGELRFLTHDEIAKLLQSCQFSSNESLIYVVKVCLATGARWSEAESLKASQVAGGKITFLNTKSGRNRTVPINEKLFDELKTLGKKGDERLFLHSLGAFRKAVARAQI